MLRTDKDKVTIVHEKMDGGLLMIPWPKEEKGWLRSRSEKHITRDGWSIMNRGDKISVMWNKNGQSLSIHFPSNGEPAKASILLKSRYASQRFFSIKISNEEQLRSQINIIVNRNNLA